MKPLLVLFAAFGLSLFVVSCGDDGEGGDVDVTLQEWSVNVKQESVEEGPVVFTIKNDGDRTHEFIIVKTDLGPDALPTKDDGSFDQDGAGVDVKEEIDDIEDGDKTSRTYTLDPGKYIFLCNRVEDIDGTETSHFDQGMRTAFEITAKD